MKKAAIAVAALALAACGTEKTIKDKTGNSGNNGGSVLGASCTAGKTACDGAQLFNCVNGKFQKQTDCAATGRVCAELAAGVFECDDAPAAPGTCTAEPFTYAGGFTFFDNDIFNSYLTIGYGEAPGFEYVQISHGPDAQGTLTIPDATQEGAPEAEVGVLLIKGLDTAAEKMFYAIGGTVTLGTHGTEEGSFFESITLTNLEAIEVVQGPEGLGIPENAETACLASGELVDLEIMRYPCLFLDNAMQVGDAACQENLLVNCEEGQLENQGTNYGKLVVGQDCAASSQTCGGTPEAPVCQ